MHLHVTTQSPRVIFKLSPRCFECIANGYVNVLVRRVNLQVLRPFRAVALREHAAQRRLMTDQDVRAGHAEFDANVKQFTPLVVPVRRLHAGEGSGS